MLAILRIYLICRSSLLSLLSAFNYSTGMFLTILVLLLCIISCLSISWFNCHGQSWKTNEWTNKTTQLRTPDGRECVCLVHQIEQDSHAVWASLGAPTAKNPPVMWVTWLRSLGWEDPMEGRMATHSSILAWKIPWTGQRSLAGYCPPGCKESDTTEQLSTLMLYAVKVG